MHRVLIINCLTESHLCLFDFYFLFSLFKVCLTLKHFACWFLFLKIYFQVMLNLCIVDLDPLSKSFSSRSFKHVCKSPFEQSSFLVKVACFINPGIESTCNLHVCCSGDEVCHNFFAQRLHLWYRVHLDTVSNFDWVFNISNLILVLILSALQLFNVFYVDVLCVGCHSLLPTCHSIELSVPIHPFLSSIQKLLCHFERANKHKPRLPNVPLG